MNRLLSVAILSAFAARAAAQAPPSAQPAKTPPSALLAAADDLLRQVSALRGLRAKGPVARGVLSRAEIGERLKARLAEEYTPTEIDTEARVLRRLGLLPPGVDYGRLMLDLLMEQVAGFYDPGAKKLFIADWLPLDMQRPALAHELQHALQDQHFDLKAFTKPLKDDGDRQLAHAALVEGDATALMLEQQAQAMRLPIEQLPDLVSQMGEQMLKGMSAEQTPLFDKAPTALRETMIFPYFGGLRFVMALRRGRPWKRVDEAFRAPPESTEQVLHPERYLSRDAPVKIPAAPLSSLAPKKEIRSDVLGELMLRLLFRSRLSEPEADRAAEGWGGDRLVAYADAPGAAPTVVDLSVWDTETDATEAAAAFRALFAKITGGKITGSAGAEGRFVDPNGEVWRVEQRGREVLCLCGAPAADGPVLDEAWQKLRPLPTR
jgi:hypothetical protein